MSWITDRGHLMQVAEGIIEDARALAVAWLEEDHAACAPRSSGEGGPISGGGRSDPVEQIATGRDLDDTEGGPRTDVGKYRDRDRLGADLLHVADKLSRMVADRKPRDTGGPCACCGERGTATHGRDERGRPTDCYACWRFLRKMGYRCADDVHEGRPEVRMCECPPECCGMCDQRATVGAFSDLCATRLRRARTA